MTRGPGRVKEIFDYIKGKGTTELFDPRALIADQISLPFDIALHDSKGISLDKSVCDMMGRRKPLTTNH